jgi:N,N'-diacetyllegionaminate synthase
MSFEDRTPRCMVIGEVAQAHDGSLGFAHAYIDAIATAGADAVKFQTHIAEAESTPGEPWRVRFSPQDASRFDYWKRTAFTEDQWLGLKRHADDRGIAFLSSPFSLEAAQMLQRIGVAGWKIASGEFNNLQTLDFVLGTGLPILLSTGMSGYEDIDRAVARISAHGNALTLFQCTTAYPCPPGKIGLNLIPELRRRYGCSVGLSDHSGTIFPGLAAATIGIEALEVHVTMSREMFGPDVPASLTTSELKLLVQGIRFIETMKASPVDKQQAAAEAALMRRLFSKSVVVRGNLPAGTILLEGDLALRKPGTGIPAHRLQELIGCRLLRSMANGEMLAEADIAPAAAESYHAA